MDRLSHAGELAINLFDNAVFPGGLNTGNAWLGIYQVLLWYESLQRYGISDLPHIIDADKLKALQMLSRNKVDSKTQKFLIKIMH